MLVAVYLIHCCCLLPCSRDLVQSFASILTLCFRLLLFPLLVFVACSEHLKFLAHVASVMVAFPFDEDEPLQINSYLSRIINTQGAKLLSSLQTTVKAMIRKQLGNIGSPSTRNGAAAMDVKDGPQQQESKQDGGEQQ